LLGAEPTWYALWVQRHQNGGVEWSALAALAACATAVAAIVVAVTTLSQVRQETQRVLFNTGLDSLWHFEAQWNSDEMLEARSAAAAALLDGRPSHDIDDVLEFFDQIALLLNRGALDDEMVCYEFYWPMANYWFASQDYARQVQQEAPGAWEHLKAVLPRLTTIEARRRKRTAEAAIPSKAQIGEFLAAEVRSGECEDDDAETRKTPL
jgi:predicted membrane-bound mannosyltransferase